MDEINRLATFTAIQVQDKNWFVYISKGMEDYMGYHWIDRYASCISTEK